MQLLMRRPEIQGFMCASLPANMYDFGFLAPCPSSGLIVHGERDMVTPTEAVTKLVTKLSQQRGIVIDFETIEGADHFFNGYMSEFEAICESYLNKRLKPVSETRPLAFAR
jgi:alpha/beta superfamily hydrolase